MQSSFLAVDDEEDVYRLSDIPGPVVWELV